VQQLVLLALLRGLPNLLALPLQHAQQLPASL
jgi:hypothetical protein